MNGKKLAILGFGHEGEAFARYALGAGAQVTICDVRTKEQLGDKYAAWQSQVSWQLGQNYLDNLTEFDLIVRSPGVRALHPKLVAAQAAGVQITSQTQEFFAHCAAPIIGITGTKGKGTTSTLIYKMLIADGKQAELVGNIGRESIGLLPTLDNQTWVVYELSSFQLQDLTHSPQVAVVLGITLDHQDYHDSPEEYFLAKTNILRWQNNTSHAIFNSDYPEVTRLEDLANGQVWHTSLAGPVKNGVYVEDEDIVRRIDDRIEVIISIQDIALKGRFNLENITAAVAAASVAGVSIEAMKSVLRTFTGLPHRLEFVRTVNGVEYWNNSYATSAESAAGAVQAFEAPQILLLGGADKGLDYSSLANAIAQKKVRAVVGIGENAPQIFTLISEISERAGSGEPFYIDGGQTMADAVKAAAKIAVSGDVVLLNPATASFDKYKNATDRGDQFKQAVQNL